LHDALSSIFSTVEKHNPLIIEERRNFLMPVDSLAQRDAFGFYQSYLDLVKPLNYKKEVD
jgi:hypothetical protein